MYSRDEVKALTDKILNMAKARRRRGGLHRRRALRHPLGQLDHHRQPGPVRSAAVRHRAPRPEDRVGVDTRDFSDAALKTMVDEATEAAKAARDNPEPQPLLGPAGLHPGRRRAAADGELRAGRARADGAARASTSARRSASLGSGYIPKTDQTTCNANSKGLFAYYQYAEAGFILTCRMADGSGSGWAGITGIKDISMIDAERITEVAANKALQEPQAEGARAWPLHRHPRAARQRALPVAHDRHLQRRRPRSRPWRAAADLTGTEKGTSKLGDKIFSDLFTLKSDVGNPILRQTPILRRRHAGEARDVGREGRSSRTSTTTSRDAARVKTDPHAGDGNMSLVHGRHRTCRSRT